MPKQVNLDNGTLLTIEDTPFTGGGEGDLHRIISPPTYIDHVVKLFKTEKRTKERERKIVYLVANPPVTQTNNAHQAVIWPKHVVYQHNKFVGLVMPMAKGEKLELLCHPKLPATLGHSWQRFSLHDPKAIELRLKICFNIAVALHQIHSLGQYVLVDMKPDNIMIQSNGLIAIIDIDSVEVLQQGKLLFAAPVATPEYTPPEYYKGLDLEKDGTTDTWDRFSMAVIFYRLLCGIHPFTGSCDAPFHTCNELTKMVENGLFPHSRTMRHHFRIVPPPHQNFSKFAQPIRDLFIRCFDGGHTLPTQRPTAGDWCNILSPEPVIQINRTLPSKGVGLASVDLSKELQLNVMPLPTFATPSYLEIPETTLLRRLYFSAFGINEKEKLKELVIHKQELTKILLREGHQLASSLSSTLSNFLKIQQSILLSEQNTINNVYFEYKRLLSSIDDQAKLLHPQEINEIKENNSNLIKQSKELVIKEKTFKQTKIEPIYRNHENHKFPIQNQLSQLDYTIKQEIEKLETMLKNQVDNIQSNIDSIENKHKARIDHELGLDNKNTLDYSFKKKYLISDNSHIIFGGIPKKAIDNLKSVGIYSAADFTDTDFLSGEIRKSTGRWVKVPSIGRDRAINLKAWLEKVNKELQQHITDLQRLANQKKATINKLMVAEISTFNFTKIALTNQFINDKKNIHQKYYNQRQGLVRSLYWLDNERDKDLQVIEKEFERLRLEIKALNTKYKSDYNQQQKYITQKYDKLHKLLSEQAATIVKEAEVKAQKINQDTQKKLIDHLYQYTSYHQEAYKLAIAQANRVREVIGELEHLQQEYISLI